MKKERYKLWGRILTLELGVAWKIYKGLLTPFEFRNSDDEEEPTADSE